MTTVVYYINRGHSLIYIQTTLMAATIVGLAAHLRGSKNVGYTFLRCFHYGVKIKFRNRKEDLLQRNVVLKNCFDRDISDSVVGNGEGFLRGIRIACELTLRNQQFALLKVAGNL